MMNAKGGVPMNVLRKRVSLLLAVALLLGLLSGCGGEEPMAEDSNEPAAEEAVTAPTPAVFFGVEAKPVIAQWDDFVFDDDPVTAAAAYADLLQNAFGFTVTEQSADERSSRWTLQYGDSGEASISLSSVFTEAEKYVVTVIYSQSIRWQDGAVYDWPEQTETWSEGGKEEAPVSGVEPVVNGPVLPDPAAFLGGIAPDEDEPADNSGWHVYYKTQIDDGWTAAHEYVELLQDSRFGFVLTECLENTTLYLKSEYYFFDYTGEEAITPASDRYYLEDYHDFSSDVFVWIQKNGQKEYTGISIYYSGDLQVADLGDRASTVPDRVSGGSGSGGSSSNDTFTPEFAKLDCLTCRGDGDCNTCGGYGEVRKYAGDGDTVRAKCSTCRGSGNCTACNGSGKR